MKKIRQIRHAKSSKHALAQNERYAFSRRYVLHVFQSNAIYNFIPKNACSTMRFSLAVANGFLDVDSDPNWIHSNVHGSSALFSPDDYTLVTSDYSFVILRCPYRRIASAFIDKAIDMRVPIARLCKAHDPSIDSKQTMLKAIQELNFSAFVEKVCSLPRHRLDEHFRPQVDFLCLEDYDRWFCLENFGEAAQRLRSDIGFILYDTRERIGHDTSRYQSCSGEHSQTKVVDLWHLKRRGLIPSVHDLYDQKSRNLVREYFHEDIELYRRKFDERNMLFDD